MKESRLGSFEELVLLLVGILKDEAYAFHIAEEYTRQTGHTTSIGAVHATLTRMENKGLLRSSMSEPSARRGGRRKRVFFITAFGARTLDEVRNIRLNLWNQFPGLAQ